MDRKPDIGANPERRETGQDKEHDGQLPASFPWRTVRCPLCGVLGMKRIELRRGITHVSQHITGRGRCTTGPTLIFASAGFFGIYRNPLVFSASDR